MIRTPLSTVIGGAFWTPKATVVGGAIPSFETVMKKLFANSEQGFFYDPNDLSTMYQNSSGTVPVTGVGQPVGLVFDKSKGLTTTTIMSQTDTFGFTGEGTTPPSTNSNTSFLGKACVSVTFPRIASGDYATSRATGAPHLVTANTFYKYRFKYALSRKLEAGEYLVIYVTGSNGTSAVQVSSATPENVWIAAELTALVNNAGYNYFTVYAAKTNSPITVYATAFSVDTVDVGNHAYQINSASRPILRQNAITGAYYLAFDGSDDFLVTNRINFTATDKVSVFAGVRKLSDAATGTIVELSSDLNANNGSFYITTSDGAAPIYRFASKGTLPIYGTLTIATGYTAPVSSVISAKGSISQDYSELRIDSVQKATTTVDQGTGNYGNYPLYIGRRVGAALPFTGHIYSLIGVGRLTLNTETASIEKELAKRLGVTLNV